MPLLIGYLISIFIFVGGGYAGLQWLADPDVRPAPLTRGVGNAAESAKPATAQRTTPSTVQGDSSMQDRQTSEQQLKPAPSPDTSASAEDAKAPEQDAKASGETSSSDMTPPVAVDPASSAPDTVAQVTPPPPANLVNPPSENRDTAAVETPGAAPPAPDTSSTAETRAEISPSAAAEATKSADSKPDAIKPERPNTTSDVSPAAIDRDAAVTKQKPAQAGTKKKSGAARVASSTPRKPVMMMMRTIEFPDGHRETRLLPMPRSGRASGFAAEPVFDED